MYEYKYIPSSIMAGAKKGGDPKNQYVELFQKTLDEQFYNASNWWTIQEESVIGSKEYENIDVRIAHVINAETGLKLGDDWKTLLFQNVNHNIELGKHYLFDNNIWITVNIEVEKNLTGTCTIRRANNTLRWIDEPTGAFYEEPCSIEYMVKEPRNYATAGSPFMTPGGFIHIEMQFNERSNLIKQNQRFLFGNPEHWTCYKVIGTGINDFRNNKTFDKLSAKILTLDLVADFVNPELDDIIEGIADVNTNLYTIFINKSSIEGAPLDTYQLLTDITYNGRTAEREVEWESSDVDIATVSSSGLVTFNEAGSCEIQAKIKGNPAFSVCQVEVTVTPEIINDIVISPNINYILEGSEKQFSVYLYTNGVQQADVFTVQCNPNSVPSKNYEFEQIDGNHFRIKNKIKENASYLTIQCSSGLNVETFNISLRGGW